MYFSMLAIRSETQPKMTVLEALCPPARRPLLWSFSI
jgi:hypothetical protein